jgi:CubicO group peptidase (beta-lactamase class C family)
MKIFLTQLLILAIVTGSTAQSKKQVLSKNIAAFNSYLQKEMQVWQIPGMAVAIVQNNEIVFTKGYGVRETGTNKIVNTKTLFSCASTTKAMTAVCMGILVDEGKIHWTDQVIKYLPSFTLYDPYVTRELTIQDLFTHTTGVGNTDFLWGDNNLTPDEILAKMQLVKPAYSLRSSFIYQNIFYLVAGKVIEKIAGKPWQVFIKERIFNPLGMVDTYATLKEIKDENLAQPHFLIDSKITIIDKISNNIRVSLAKKKK